MDLKTHRVAEVDMAVWADVGGHRLPSLRVAPDESNDALEGATCLLRADVVTATVVLVPEPGSRVLLLVAVLDYPDPLAGTCVLSHDHLPWAHTTGAYRSPPEFGNPGG